MSDINEPLSVELSDIERRVLAERLKLNAEEIERVSYFSPAEGPGRVVVTAVVELKKSEQ